MDDRILTEETEREIQDLMIEMGISRYVALVVLGLLPGKISGDGDLFRLRPLTEDECRRFGLDPRSIRDLYGNLDNSPREHDSEPSEAVRDMAPLTRPGNR